MSDGEENAVGPVPQNARRENIVARNNKDSPTTPAQYVIAASLLYSSSKQLFGVGKVEPLGQVYASFGRYDTILRTMLHHLDVNRGMGEGRMGEFGRHIRRGVCQQGMPQPF